MLKAIITAGPTREKIDPVRYISNYSSGKQGYAIAEALAEKGVEVTLIAGPVDLPDPENVRVIKIESASGMMAAVEAQLPADIAVCAAAVCDWSADNIAGQKMKKISGQDEMNIKFVKNPDVLAAICAHASRPGFVIGFAAETENVIENAIVKLENKGCDLILANDVSTGVFGADENQVAAIFKDGSLENWPLCAKADVASRLVELLSKRGML